VNKARVNYWVDAGIGLAFVLSAASGLVFLLPMEWTAGGIVGISMRSWSQVHTWSSLAMISGVVLHVVLHWKWISAMTRCLVPKVNAAGAPAVSRRNALVMAGTVAVALTFSALGAKTLLKAVAAADNPSGAAGSDGPAPLAVQTEGYAPAPADNPADGSADAPGESVTESEAATRVEEQPQVEPTAQSKASRTSEPTATRETPTTTVSPSPTPTAELAPLTGVACPFGLVYDRYPGRCRRYIDKDGDGFCDHSIPGSGA